MFNDSGNEAMTTLQAQWYNAMVAGLRLDPNTFQIVQPNVPLGNMSDSLWAYFNNLPPATLVNELNLSGGNQFYADYKAVVAQLESQNSDAFQRDLGDAYPAWMQYVKGLSPSPAAGDLAGVFRSWAMINYPNLASVGANDLEAILNDPIFAAQMAVNNTSGFINGVPNFSKTIADLRSALQSATGASFSFDSETASSNVQQTWAEGAVGLLFDFFEGENATEYSSLSQQAALSRVTVQASFKSLLQFAAAPGSWYVSSALGTAFATPDNTVWNHGTPNWNSTFGPQGNMLRFLTTLIVADGIDLTVTSQAVYNSDQQQTIKTETGIAIWPFFFGEASATVTTDVSFSSEGYMTAHISSPAGNPVVIGANVTPVKSFLGAS
ncbi:MAG: hypothetical protein HC933_03940 [Pleurocapsa sp. SU_196_0]|nr:hypothetical protein [Pleurocapsa sp. SU_196_0]